MNARLKELTQPTTLQTFLDIMRRRFGILITNQTIPDSKLVTITPECAEELRALNSTNNRKLSLPTSNSYSNDMGPGEWMVNGDAIRIDTFGNLIDGQHRLDACIKSSVPFQTFITWNIQARAIHTIDKGRKRSNADSLRIYNIPNPYEMAAALNLIWKYENNHLWNRSLPVSGPMIDAMYQVHGLKMQESLSVAKQGKRQNLAPQSILAFCHFLFSKQNDYLAGQFFDKLFNGVNLTEDEPVRRLRDRFITNRGYTRTGVRSANFGRRNLLGTSDILALCFKAWNLTKNGQSCKLLVVRTDENYPEI